ncbi:hypothetical protein KC660_02790 [Candidatus Dojkabacteria bacterium]|uniref:Uncharacterized protein n=1 Tax=Candidatus Dojkabacteria bacterium TaxID=2099670 RepID=A0A955L3P4_9BACT|nr:hypothetical protein [Candidatus Dojkabacteria bacterium]
MEKNTKITLAIATVFIVMLALLGSAYLVQSARKGETSPIDKLLGKDTSSASKTENTNPADSNNAETFDSQVEKKAYDDYDEKLTELDDATNDVDSALKDLDSLEDSL